MWARYVVPISLLLCIAGRCKPASAPNKEPAQASQSYQTTLQFLFDKRLALFNTRRDHEWRVAFGALALIGAVDAGLLTKGLHLSREGIWIWWSALICLFLAVTVYQFGVQTRNRVDRRAMDAIYSELCNLFGTPVKSPVRVGIDRASNESKPISSSIWRWTYLWAFVCQTVVLLACCVLSAALPYVINGAFQVPSPELPECWST